MKELKMSVTDLFPQVVEIPGTYAKAGYEKKCIFHEKILYHYLQRKIWGWSVGNFLEEEKIEKYALYAITDFTSLFLTDIEQKKGKESFGVICDKNAGAFPFGYKGEPVLMPEELICRYRSGSIRKIIVMSILHENEIIDELMDKGVLLKDIISFVSVIYS